MMTPTAKKTLLTVLVACFGVQTALVYTDERVEGLSEAAVRGRRLWHDHGCQVCHQIYGQGGFLGPDVTNAHGLVDSVRLRSLLTVGSGQMPAFQFDDTQIADLRAFLRALDQPGRGRGQLRLGDTDGGAAPWDRFEQALMMEIGAESRGGNVKRGWQAIRKRSCRACHQPFTVSPTSAPDLSLTTQRLTAAELRTTLGQGRPLQGMPPPAPAFDPEELQDVFAFLEWLGGNRNALEERFRAAEPDRTIDWTTVPWWEYR
jgi:nitric oxide reductase subunit C